MYLWNMELISTRKCSTRRCTYGRCFLAVKVVLAYRRQISSLHNVRFKPSHDTKQRTRQLRINGVPDYCTCPCKRDLRRIGWVGKGIVRLCGLITVICLVIIDQVERTSDGASHHLDSTVLERHITSTTVKGQITIVGDRRNAGNHTIRIWFVRSEHFQTIWCKTWCKRQLSVGKPLSLQWIKVSVIIIW